VIGILPTQVCTAPEYRDLAGFDFASREINEELVRHLHRCGIMAVADSIARVGSMGTYKPHIATAWRSCCRTSS